MLYIQAIGAMDRGDLIAAIGPAFERSPWVAEAGGRRHVPLLVAPWGRTTYRGG